MRKIYQIIEDEVRLRFGHKKIGEAWVSETILYNIVRNIFSDKEIQRHFRPDFLEGLEYDIYLPALKTAIEYQGYQHFQPIACWGGENGLKELKKRDKRKARLSEQNGIRLCYFKFDESLTEINVRRILQ